MRIEVVVPPLLSDCTHGRTRFMLEASTVNQAVERLLGQFPLLKIHLFTEGGQIRKHVLLFHNETNLAWLAHWDVPLKQGDRLLVLQAVSGG